MNGHEKLIEEARTELFWMKMGVPLTASLMRRLADALESEGPALDGTTPEPQGEPSGLDRFIAEARWTEGTLTHGCRSRQQWEMVAKAAEKFRDSLPSKQLSSATDQGKNQ